MWNVERAGPSNTQHPCKADDYAMASIHNELEADEEARH